MSNQLHQLLAVKQDLEKKGDMIIRETINTFSKKADHFDGVIKPYVSLNTEADEQPTEIKEIVTTVGDKIGYSREAIARAIDARVSLEETNASGSASAEVKVGDHSFGTFSSIALLAIEEWLTKIRLMYKEIPTLDPAKQWNLDSQAGEGVYKTPPEVKFRTINKEVPLVLYEATDKHPAQVQLVTNSIQVGKWETTYKSGRISPAQKSDLLERIDEILLAVKRAKASANQANVKQIKLGEDIFSFVNNGII